MVAGPRRVQAPAMSTRETTLLALTVLLSFACTVSEADEDEADEAGQGQMNAAIELPGEAFYPEGIAIDGDANIYIGSLTEGSVQVLRAGEGAVETLVASGAPDERSVGGAVGMLHDDALGVLWVCDAGGFITGTERPTALVGVDSSSGAVVARHVLAGGGLCNDMTLDAAGNLYVSDSFNPRVLRLAADDRLGEDALVDWASFEDWAVEPGGFGLNGLDVDGDLLWVSHTDKGAIYRVPIVDEAPGDIVELDLDRVPAGIDGLKTDANGDIVFVEGYAELITRVEVDGDSGQLTTLSLGALDGPTTFALSGTGAWIVEGQLPHLLDPSLGPPNLPFQAVFREL